MNDNDRKIAFQMDNSISDVHEKKSDLNPVLAFIETPQSIDVSNAGANASASVNSAAELEPLKEKIIAALQEIYDPEIPVNIYDLGLIYAVEIDASLQVAIKMTLTSPMCPVAQTFPQTVQDRILQVEGVASVTVDLVWDPPWTKENMTDAVRLQLNLF